MKMGARWSVGAAALATEAELLWRSQSLLTRRSKKLVHAPGGITSRWPADFSFYEKAEIDLVK
jgi:hypothetical protein